MGDNMEIEGDSMEIEADTQKPELLAFISPKSEATISF